ncbi:MAG: alanine--tRNA ligase [Nanoarchaeota archaeon]|nr:alanine--tRNA ligase [Nanoarchaeota archaeon]
MLTKVGLKKEFAKDWKHHYEVPLFKTKGFVRKTCACGKHFWTLAAERTTCGDPPCDPYGFLGKPITKKNLDYLAMWHEFATFFKKHKHAVVNRYPVIDRWRPDLYFTIASIQDFQRIEHGRVVMEYPADPLVVPQVCLRFNDIPNVGVTGRHHTGFIMGGQHSFGNYWKERCIELNFEFLTKTLGIPETELTYVEDVWSMPDFSQFGPSVETFSRGLELVNSVFSQFTAKGTGYTELPRKVIDVGWGHERLVWFSQGTPTGYDAVFGPVITWMKQQSGQHDTALFDRYAVLAGGLDVEDGRNMQRAREQLAKQLAVTPTELRRTVAPMQALYAVADHTKSLLFAIADGGIPSNIGGGYNLRVILRRALSFMKEFEFPFTIQDVASRHATFLKPLFPELKRALPIFNENISVETDRYIKTMDRGMKLAKTELKKGKLTTKKLVTMYVSNGITPEIVDTIAKQEGVPFTVPDDFYSKLTEHTETGKKELETELKINVSGTASTKLLYYQQPYAKTFSATIVSVHRGWVAFDRTLFYSEGGGQPADHGTIEFRGKTHHVTDVQKVQNVVFHKVVPVPKTKGKITGTIDWDRRYQLMQMHTATHVLGGVARKLLGPQIWQAGAKKGVTSSRLDVTHYQPFTPQDLKKLEDGVNNIVKGKQQVGMHEHDRGAAEQRYGFVLYQGGASPGKTIRVVNIGDVDTEACGGTHLRNTSEIGRFVIMKTERIADGVNRIEFTCGAAAEQFVHKQEQKYKEAVATVTKHLDVPIALQEADILRELRETSTILSCDQQMIPKTLEKFASQLTGDASALTKVKTLPQLAETVFQLWKQSRKQTVRERTKSASSVVETLEQAAKNNQIRTILDLTRKELITVADDLLKRHPDWTIVLANNQGELVAMSKTQDAGKLVQTLAKRAGGAGGGKPTVGQGKADPKKLKHLL